MKSVIIAALCLVALAAEAEQCYQFGGKTYCPPKDGSQLVLPCNNAGCMSERPIPVLPTPAPVVQTATVTAVVAPVDKDGKPSEFVNGCGQYGCSVSKAPIVAVEVPPPPPPTVVWVQPPPVQVPTVIMWGPYNGTGPWNLPSGPPLRRHH